MCAVQAEDRNAGLDMADLDVVGDDGDNDKSDEECDGNMLLHLLLSFDGRLVLILVAV